MAGRVGWNPPTKYPRGSGEKAPDRVSPVGEKVKDFMYQLIQNEQPLGGAQTQENIDKAKI